MAEISGRDVLDIMKSGWDMARCQVGLHDYKDFDEYAKVKGGSMCASAAAT